jgi:hypothetical protein
MLSEDDNELVLEPPAEAFYESIAQVQVAFVEQVKVVGRLLFNDKLQVGMSTCVLGYHVSQVQPSWQLFLSQCSTHARLSGCFENAGVLKLA